MATLTSDQRADMQGDLGISDDENVFTNEELNRLYTRADSNYALAVYYGYRQLLADAAKLHNYSLAQTRVERSQVFDHVKAMMAVWQDEARTAGNQVKIAGLRGVPPRWKDAPAEKRGIQPAGWRVTTEDDR
jgi:hypothetical protein